MSLNFGSRGKLKKSFFIIVEISLNLSWTKLVRKRLVIFVKRTGREERREKEREAMCVGESDRVSE
jgi:hypothetical protein